MTRLETGHEFAGYQVLAPLGEGGMGQVYLVEHPHLLRREALKIISVTASHREEFHQRFTNEARTVALLRHPGIVAIHHYGVENGSPWFTMTYLDGQDLAAGGLSDAEIGVVATRAADALDYAHRHQVIHRDVKPANIIVTREDDGSIDQVVLLDFGIAKLADSTRFTATQAFIGTLAYAAPELLDGLPAGPATDQYALACTVYELLTGVAPFEAPTPSAMMAALLSRPAPLLSVRRPDLVALDPIFHRALAKDPSLRFPDCRSFAAGLADVLRTSAAGPRPTVDRGASTPDRVSLFGPDGPVSSVTGTPHTGMSTAPGSGAADSQARESSAADSDAATVDRITPRRQRRRRAILLAAITALVVVAVAIAATVLTTRSNGSPADPRPPTGQISAISVGTFTTCAVRDRAAYCWGKNDEGQIGDGTTTSRSVPTRVAGLTDVTDIVTSSTTTCAVASAELYCWGSKAARPRKVSGLSDVTDVSTNGFSFCAIADSYLFCWGGNSSGQLGDGARWYRTAPTKVEGIRTVTAVSVGEDSTCAISGSNAYCWGGNSSGQLGDGTTVDRAEVTQVKNLQFPGSVSTGGLAGRGTTCAVTADYAGYCWGANEHGQLGDGTATDRRVPTKVRSGPLLDIDTSENTTCAVTTAREVECWGSVRAGADDVLLPATINGLRGVTAVSVGDLRSCAIARDGAYCWGGNIDGAIGDGTTTSRTAPARVTFP
ncbi:protein kinase domain-containing protein [Gordonia sp. NPDC003376]